MPALRIVGGNLALLVPSPLPVLPGPPHLPVLQGGAVIVLHGL